MLWMMASWTAWPDVTTVQALALAPIYWSTTNSLFKSSKNNVVVEVNLDDQIDFVCPVGSPLNSSSAEYYIIYQVTRSGYESCNIHSASSKATMILNCSNPSQPKRFTMLFELFQSIPNAPEFEYGQTYYYISTSTGDTDGLMNTDLGACHYHNLRLIIHVCCDTTTVSTSPLLTTSRNLLDTSTSTTVPKTGQGQGQSQGQSQGLSATYIPLVGGKPSSTTTTSSRYLDIPEVKRSSSSTLLAMLSTVSQSSTDRGSRQQQSLSNASNNCFIKFNAFVLLLVQTLVVLLERTICNAR